VFNGIGVTPPEQDSEAGVTDAVLQVLEKDPFVNSESIRIHTRRAVVTLDGAVPREAEVKLAEDEVGTSLSNQPLAKPIERIASHH